MDKASNSSRVDISVNCVFSGNCRESEMWDVPEPPEVVAKMNLRYPDMIILAWNYKINRTVLRNI